MNWISLWYPSNLLAKWLSVSQSCFKNLEGQFEERHFRAVKSIFSTCQTAYRSILKMTIYHLVTVTLRFGTQEYVTVICTGWKEMSEWRSCSLALCRYLSELLAERQNLGPFMQVLPNCSRLLNQGESPEIFIWPGMCWAEYSIGMVNVVST